MYYNKKKINKKRKFFVKTKLAVRALDGEEHSDFRLVCSGDTAPNCRPQNIFEYTSFWRRVKRKKKTLKTLAVPVDDRFNCTHCNQLTYK